MVKSVLTVIKTRRTYTLQELFFLMENPSLESKFGKIVLERDKSTFSSGHIPIILVKGVVNGILITVQPVMKSIQIDCTADPEKVAEYNAASEGLVSDIAIHKITVGDVATGVANEAASGCFGWILDMIPGFRFIQNALGVGRHVKRHNELQRRSQENIPVIQALRDEISRLVELR